MGVIELFIRQVTYLIATFTLQTIINLITFVEPFAIVPQKSSVSNNININKTIELTKKT